MVVPFLKKLKNCDYTSVQQLSRSGDPDIYACIGGVFVALELKASEKSRLRPLQAWKLEKIKSAGGLAMVVTPENWPEVMETLTRLGEKNDA